MVTELEDLTAFAAKNRSCWVCDVKTERPENPGIEKAIAQGHKVGLKFGAIRAWLKERHSIEIEDNNKNRNMFLRHCQGAHDERA